MKLKVVLIVVFITSFLLGYSSYNKSLDRYKYIAEHFLSQKAIYFNKEKKFIEKERLKPIPTPIVPDGKCKGLLHIDINKLKNVVLRGTTEHGIFAVVKKKDGLYIYLLRKNNGVPIIFKDMK